LRQELRRGDRQSQLAEQERKPRLEDASQAKEV
jgi:hypothetical protein